MFGIDWLVVGLLLLAGFRAVADAVLDGIALLRNPGGEAPSVVRRRARAELSQKQAAARVELAERQRAAGVPPAPGQAAADRLARFIADPPPWPPWVIAAASYLGLLLADRLARARRNHVAKEANREARERGEPTRTGKPGDLFCECCDVNPVAKKGAICPTCALVVKQECRGCGVHVAVAELQDAQDRRCSMCRAATSAATSQPPPGTDLTAVRLIVPWLPAEPSNLRHH